jgi:hypothetical protein
MKRAIAALYVLLSSASLTVTVGQSTSRSAVLPDVEARKLKDTCSRGLVHFDDTWRLGNDVVCGLNEKLQQLSNVTKSHAERRQLLPPHRYHFQYIGIVVRGRRLVYVNAISGDMVREDWRTVFADICGGGPGAWSVLYDPASRAFVDLWINAGR